MPIPRWLHSLLSRKPPETSAPPPPRGEGWGGRPGTTPIQPPSDPSPPVGGETHFTPDTSHRIHIAANDPGFPAKREAAIALICQAITDIATPLGYTRKGTTWSRTTARGKSAIHLQRSRYGFTASLTLRFLTPDGTALNHGVWAQDDDIRLRQFYLQSESCGTEAGEITYLDVYENPVCLNEPMHILATRGLPWLDAHQTASFPPDIAAFRLR